MLQIRGMALALGLPLAVIRHVLIRGCHSASGPGPVRVVDGGSIQLKALLLKMTFG
jgi:hypothetical protein